MKKMVTEYHCWIGSTIIKKNSLDELRKVSIYKMGRSGSTDVFKKGSALPIGRLYCGMGAHWLYRDNDNSKIYEINENGTVKR